MFLLSLFAFCLSACERQPVYPAPPVSGGDVVIDLSMLKPGTPHFYTHVFQGRNISFFVISMEGKTVSFFDACATCYPHKRGYRCEDGAVICRSCNMRFPIYKLEKGLGGCFPVKLEGRTEGGKYIIPLAAIEAEAGKF